MKKMTWSFEHSIFTYMCRNDAWAYWSNIEHHAQIEPGVERIELDGPFATGTTGRTIASGFQQEWIWTKVIDGQQYVITGLTPDGDGGLSVARAFEDEGTGTRMTHRISAYGPQVKEYTEEFQLMGVDAPKGMTRLVAELDRLALGEP
jgi:hypothetical protein